MKIEFTYAGNKLEFELDFSKRKTIKIAVETPDTIKVTAPLGLSQKAIIETVKSKAPWILKRIYLLENMSLQPVHNFATGEKFLYLGEEITLKVTLNQCIRKAAVILLNNGLIVESPSLEKEKVRNALEIWYRGKTSEKVKESINKFQPFFSAYPRQIKVKEQKRRWASCTYLDDILFNWRCVMAKPEVIDYIVVHEMCHMVHKNHSKDFWNLVQQIIPDYKERTLWLKNNGSGMDF